MRRRLRLVVAAVPLLLTTSCGALGDTNNDGPKDVGLTCAQGSKEPTQSQQSQRAKLTIATQPVIESVILWAAVEQGYFTDACIDIDPKNDISTGKSGQDVLAKITSGDVDLGTLSYPPAIVAASKGHDIKLVVDSYQAAPKTFEVVSLPTSRVKSERDLQHARVGIPARYTITDIALSAVMNTRGVDPKSVQWTEVPFANMGAALQQNQIDAAVLPEPFLTLYGLDLGALPFLDVAQGDVANIPLSGWFLTGKFAREHPLTVQAIQSALGRGRDYVRKDREAMNALMVNHLKVRPDVANLLNVGVFPDSIDATRLQRIPDLMFANRAIDANFDIHKIML